MNSKRRRIRLVPVGPAISSMTLLGGCTHADPAILEAFVTDLLRSVAAALLL